MSPIINWEELRQVLMPPDVARAAGGEGGNMFDNDRSANMYNQIARMEKTYTLNQVDAFDTSKKDTVLDIGCGPGRITVPMAKKAKRVTALDSSERMLAHCRRNVEEAGLSNVDFRVLDWRKAILGENLEQHDIVIASRSVGGQDLKKVSSFARKYVVVIAWANAPNVPTVVGDLFVGVEGAQVFSKMREDRRVGYNVTYNTVYDAGYDPNIKIVRDGFTSDFGSKEEAYKELWKLQPIEGRPPKVFKDNVDKWLTKNKDGGVTFRRETRSFVLWWEPNQAKV